MSARAAVPNAGKTLAGFLGWLVVCLSLLSWSALPLAGGLELSSTAEAAVSLTEHIALLEDPAGELSISDVTAAPYAGQFSGGLGAGPAISRGYTRSAFWLRLELGNRGAPAAQRLLEIAYAPLDTVELYVQRPNGEFDVTRTGGALPFATRPHANHNFVFPLSVPADGQATLYLRVRSASSIILPLKLWTPDAFFRHERNDYQMQAWYFGMASAMLLFNFLIWLALRDAIYLRYVVFAASMSLALGADRGLAHEFVWPGASGWTAVANFIGYSLSVTALMNFTRHMLDTWTIAPRADKVMGALSAYVLVVSAGFFIEPHAVAVPVVLGYVACAACLLAVALYCLAVKRSRTALIFMVAFGVLLGGCLLAGMMYLGIVESSELTRNAIPMGSAAEMILLALALADRFNQARRERELAQQEQLQAEKRLVDNLRESEQRLEARVTERTTELTAALVTLQKTQRELVESEKLASLTGLVAGIAHEMNTPVGNALVTATSLQASADDFMKRLNGGPLRRAELADFLVRQRDMADLVHRSCERAAALVSSFKRVAVDHPAENRLRFPLSELVESCIAALRPDFKQAGVRVEASIDPAIELDSYPEPLRQIITNCVENALQHAFVGRSTGLVRLGACVAGEQLELSCSDDGNGMPSEVIARVFEPFFTTRLGAGGSGLGLSVCLSIARGILGGDIEARSTPGSGSTFVVRIPIVATYARVPAPRAAVARHAAPTVSKTSRS